MPKELKEKKGFQFPKDGLLIENHRIIIDKCCKCGFRHAFYFEVLRGKKQKDDLIYVQCELIND